METKRKWRFGVNRWIVLACVILGIIGANNFAPVQPHILVKPEELTSQGLIIPGIGEIKLTNTMVAMFIVDALLVLMIIAVQRAVRKSSLVPSGFSGAIEFLLEALYGLTETSAGKWARRIFPYFFSIFIVVLVGNFTKLLPGVESIGFLEESPDGVPIQHLFGSISTIIPTGVGPKYTLVAFVRGLPTDLNFTVALALFSVIMTQVIGVRSQGFRYFSKFFNTLTLFSKPGFGAIDLAVSILELISEFAKILSFSFRLFGNMFAGMILLVLMGTMLPVFFPSLVLLFEVFIGAIQAFVFGMLTMVFMSQAAQGHGGEEHKEDHKELHAEVQASQA